MKTVVIVFPGSNREPDMVKALEIVCGERPSLVWHRETSLPKTDLIVIPGGFSYGDYLRVGCMAARSPIIREVKAKAESGVQVLGVCNGFQVLTEVGLLPGALMRNVSLKFLCKNVYLRVEDSRSPCTATSLNGKVIEMPIAHHDGNFFADSDTIQLLEAEQRIVFRYCGPDGEVTPEHNPNGSQRNIAGICNKDGNVLGMMPHPENATDAVIGGIDGKVFFEGIMTAVGQKG